MWILTPLSTHTLGLEWVEHYSVKNKGMLAFNMKLILTLQ